MLNLVLYITNNITSIFSPYSFVSLFIEFSCLTDVCITKTYLSSIISNNELQGCLTL